LASLGWYLVLFYGNRHRLTIPLLERAVVNTLMTEFCRLCDQGSPYGCHIMVAGAPLGHFAAPLPDRPIYDSSHSLTIRERTEWIGLGSPVG
jgi:hypothetical protein